MLIHFWNLPEKRNYIVLKEEFKQNLLSQLNEKDCPWKIKEKIKNGKLSIEKIKGLAKKENIPLYLIEENISWVGGNNSKGLSNPKFAINFLTKNAARFIAAIVNDGTLKKENKNSKGRIMYDNFDESLRNSVLQDCLSIFGGKSDEIAFRNSEKKKYLEFSSVIRDIMELILKSKGPKCETNIEVPSFILESEDLISSWIEQTVGDEGEVKYYPNKYRRAIVWRRSLDVTDLFNKKIDKDIPLRTLSKNMQEVLNKKRCNLITAEEKMLNLLGIKYRLYNLGLYPTVKNKIRTRWQISITKRENLLKLRKLIKIPSEIKDLKLTAITEEFVRCKEPSKIREKIVELGKRSNSFTSI